MLVNQLLLVNNLTLDGSLLQNLDAFRFQACLHQLLDLVCHCMRLDEDKSRVLRRRLVQFGQLHSFVQARISIHIFKGIKDRPLFLCFNLHLWIH